MVFNVFFLGYGLFLGTCLRVASLRNSSFRERLKERDILVKVRLVKPDKSGYLFLKKGRLKPVRRRNGPPPDILIEWSDVPAAVRSVLKIHPKDLVESMHNEIASGRLRVEFNVASSVWFLNTMRQLLVVLSGSGSTWPF